LIGTKPFRPLALVLGIALFAGGFFGQIWLRTFLGSSSTLSPDAVLAVSFGAEAFAFLVAGFLLSFAARGNGAREFALAALIVGAGAFAFLYRYKAPSFSRDRFLASRDEIILWSILTAAGAFLLALWGSSAGVILGASGKVDASFAFEAGIARTHLRLNRRSAVMLAMLALIPSGLFVGTAYYAQWHQQKASGTVVKPLELWMAIAGLAAVGMLLFALGRIYMARVALAKLQPGQRKKRPATVVMTAISIAGVGVGVWALTVVLSVMSGFEADLKRKILGTNSHAWLQKYHSNFKEWRDTLKQVSGMKEVVGATPFILREVMLSQRDALTGAELKGIDPQTVGKVSDLPAQVTAGDLDWLLDSSKIPAVPPPPKEGKGGANDSDYLHETFERRRDHADERVPKGVTAEALAAMPGICIGKEMSRTLVAWVGDVINIINPVGGGLGPTGPTPQSKAFRVACIFYSGFYEYDSKFAYISLTEAQKFFRTGDNITGLELKFRDVDAARAESQRVRSALGGFPYQTKDWADMNRNLFSALKLEKLAMAIILTFIVLVACFNILSTLIMLVLEKTKEISILKSMGARDSSVMKVFVIEGLSIGGIGTGIGLLLGWATCLFIERFGLQLDPDVYYVSSLPVSADGGQFAVVAGIAIALSYLATLYPAIKASKLSPVDGLRED